mgnify:FL=1
MDIGYIQTSMKVNLEVCVYYYAVCEGKKECAPLCVM